MSQKLDQTQEAPLVHGDDPRNSANAPGSEFEGWHPRMTWEEIQSLVAKKLETKHSLKVTFAALSRLGIHHASSFAEDRIESLPRHNSGMEEKEARDKQIALLREERDKLANQAQLLQSLNAELRRTVARETRRFDQLQCQVDKLIDCVNQRGKANDCLLSGFISRPDSRLRMFQSYEGVTEDAHGDRVVVVYDVDGKIVEQTYEKTQFNDSRMPEVGTRLAVYVIVAEVEPKPIDPGIEESDPRDESGSTRRKSLSGPTEF